jgi:PadR family transcriptional regulator, regulatory protein PadR
MGKDKDKAALLQGTLDLLVLKTVETMGPLHGWAVAKRIEQISRDLLEMKYGTLYPALMRLEQRGWISSEWGTSENNRRARFYSITRQGRKQLALEARSWEQMAAFITRMLGSTR